MAESRRVRLRASTKATRTAASEVAGGGPAVAVQQREVGAGERGGEEAGEDRDRVELDQLLLVAAGGEDHRRGEGEHREHAPVGDEEAVLAVQALGQQAGAAVEADPRERLQHPRSGQERGGRGGEQQQGAEQLEGGEGGAVADRGAGDLGQQGAVLAGQADPQVDGEQREAEGEPADDRDHRPEGRAPEPAAAAVVELGELGDRVGGCLDAGRQGHAQGQGQQHRGEAGVGEEGAAALACRMRPGRGRRRRRRRSPRRRSPGRPGRRARTRSGRGGRRGRRRRPGRRCPAPTAGAPGRARARRRSAPPRRPRS